ncbi:oxoglutarate/iron-dependent dioxygenase [Artemisia annua]|uniref:Oxoglutarate/iron-dependent dioxygenase n=1 Tax=Artemisia annua TaxID=35608 RepID=A0A2U1P4S9_ARTAN|nr:oxoglutarate/iron-dependent dioxygenase [Artemisia annua]
MASLTAEQNYDHLKEVTQFDESKLGAKGLLDSGITTIPRIFHQPPENLPGPQPKTRPQLTVPVIDLSQDRSKVVEEIRRCASTLGFFQIVNHSIPVTLIGSVLNDTKKFYEQSTEYKMQFYGRETENGATYATNLDLYQSKAASWRDTIEVWMSPKEPKWEAVPEMCWTALKDWDKAVVGLAEELMAILCEGLGNEIGGLLQAKCGEDWVVVEAVPGAVVINIGDMLQMMSNDAYRSVEHRVLANNAEVAPLSFAVFFEPSNREGLYGPFPELISAEKPVIYHKFMFEDFCRRFLSKELDGKSKLDYYRIDNTNKA